MQRVQGDPQARLPTHAPHSPYGPRLYAFVSELSTLYWLSVFVKK